MILPSIVYKLLNDYDNFPYIFICLFKSQFSVMIHITISYIVESTPQPLLTTPIFYLGVISYYVSNNLFVYSLLVASRSTSVTLYIISLIFFYLSISILILATYVWLKYVYILRNNLTSANKHCNEYYMCSLYLCVLWFAITTSLLETALVSVGSLLDCNQSCILMNIASFTVIGAFLSVLPG